MTRDEAISALRAVLVRDRHGYWWVNGGRNSDYNRALDALLGKPEAQQPDLPRQRKGPRKPKLVIQ